MPNKKNLPLIIAHRGSSAHAPENTVAAFRRAIDEGADGIEFDVRLAKDGVAVVFHDLDLKRTAGKIQSVSELTSRQLAKIDVGSWFNKANRKYADPEYTKETVPTLAKTLEALNGFRGPIYIELKFENNDFAGLVKAVCTTINASKLLPQIIVKSFALSALPYLRMGSPKAAVAALFAPQIMNFLRKKKQIAAMAKAFGANHISLHHALVSRKLMTEAANEILPVTLWTTDNPRWIGRAQEFGIKALITNDPARLIAHRDKIQKEKHSRA